jgi:hypothetical protein
MQPPQHRTDVRFSRIRLGQRRAIDVAEAFNVFNRPNWTLSTQEAAPIQQARAGRFRTMQFGFRLTF